MNRWLVPLVSAAMGVVFVAVGLVSGDVRFAVAGGVVMTAYAAFLLLGARSETVKVLHGRPPDERYLGFAVNALALSGLVTPLAMLGLGMYEILTGGDGQPYALLCFLAGAVFAGSLLWQRFRS